MARARRATCEAGALGMKAGMVSGGTRPLRLPDA